MTWEQYYHTKKDEIEDRRKQYESVKDESLAHAEQAAEEWLNFLIQEEGEEES